jgi:hypothetical protein
MLKTIVPKEWKQCFQDLQNNCKDFSDSEYIFLRYLKIIDSNKQLNEFPKDFLLFVNRCYYHSALLFIRRLSDKDPQSVSLVTLLRSFLEHPTEFMKIDTAKYECYKLSNTRICDDIHKVLQVCATINKKVNKRGIGHLDRDSRNPEYLFKQTEYDETLIALKNLANKYFDIFGFAGFGSEEYEIAYDWQKIFTISWIKNEENTI